MPRSLRHSPPRTGPAAEPALSALGGWMAPWRLHSELLSGSGFVLLRLLLLLQEGSERTGLAPLRLEQLPICVTGQ